MTLPIADMVALALAEGPQPCEAFPVMPEPKHLEDLPDRCDRPDTRLYLVGCAHEHVTELWLCQECANQSDARRYCGECYDGTAASHLCDVMVSPAGGRP